MLLVMVLHYIVKIVYSLIVDVGCFSHTLDLVESKFVTPCLSTFMVWWISLFSHSPKARLFWKEQTGYSAASECVFSLLNNLFSESQNSLLQDYIEISLMLQYI